MNKQVKTFKYRFGKKQQTNKKFNNLKLVLWYFKLKNITSIDNKNRSTRYYPLATLN